MDEAFSLAGRRYIGNLQFVTFGYHVPIAQAQPDSCAKSYGITFILQILDTLPVITAYDKCEKTIELWYRDSW